MVTSASQQNVNVLGLADRIGRRSVSSLGPQALMLSLKPPCKATCTEITRQFWGWSVFCAALCRDHLSNTVQHCDFSVSEGSYFFAACLAVGFVLLM